MRTDIVIHRQPTPPTPPLTQSGSIGDAIKQTVGNALGGISAEMSKELAKEVQKRDALQARLDKATSSKERGSLQQQVAEADVNIAKLEAAVAKLNAKAGDLGGDGGGPTWTTGTTPPYFPPQEVIPENMIISVISIIFIGFPLAIAFARLLWKRSNAMPTAASTNQLPADSARRFDELSHSVDAIAIEVERISENQRYLTKLLSEPRQSAAVGAGRGGAPPAS